MTSTKDDQTDVHGSGDVVRRNDRSVNQSPQQAETTWTFTDDGYGGKRKQKQYYTEEFEASPRYHNYYSGSNVGFSDAQYSAASKQYFYQKYATGTVYQGRAPHNNYMESIATTPKLYLLFIGTFVICLFD